MQKTNLGLAEWARDWLGSAYWYGCVCYRCSEELLARKARQYPRHYTEARMPRYRADIAAGRRATDCIGLAKGYMWWDEERSHAGYEANGCPDSSADGMYEAATVKGGMADLPEVPGIMLWKPGHAGVYMGGGRAIEARGFDYGVVETALGERGWQAWYQLPGCAYPGAQSGALRVTAGALNVRRGPGVGYAVLGVAHRGDVLRPAPGGWLPVEYGGEPGWVSARYVEAVE